MPTITRQKYTILTLICGSCGHELRHEEIGRHHEEQHAAITEVSFFPKPAAVPK